MKPGDAYVISDPELLADPQRVLDVFDADGNLDRLGIKPSQGPSAEPDMGTLQTSSRTYTVPSQRFPRGRKPADPYQYITGVDECAEHDSSGDESGWLKNRFSYCQRHLIVIPAVQCGLWPPGCHLRGLFISRNTIIGYGKIGGWDGGSLFRRTEFDLDVDVIVSEGHFNRPGSRMKATLNCHGTWQGGGGNTKDACDDGLFDGRTASPRGWQRDGEAKFDLVSIAPKPPSAEAGPQIANAEFQPIYEFTIPGYTQFQPTEGEVGYLRFDSAWYITRTSPEGYSGNLGSVFSDGTPALRYDRSDVSDPNAAGEPYLGVASHADHVGDARDNPDATLPPKDDKKLPGAEPDDPLFRVAQGAGVDQAARIARNRAIVTAYCNSGAVPGGPAEGMDCDEYPYASTYQGAARFEFQGDKYRDDYSVRYINSTENQEAGRRLLAWYENDRILDWDGFVIKIGS